ncbi:MAG: energy transducer TonB [Endomicrobium sp.]|jgi:TonB family protein|nr:energy transducer TonB [Endomicrobium sp.]
MHLSQYETISNTGGVFTVIALLLFSMVVLQGEKPIVLSGTGTTVSMSIEYAQELTLNSETTKEQEDVKEEVISQKAYKDLTENSAVDKQTPQKNVQENPNDAAQEGFDLSKNDEFLNYFLHLIQSSLYYPKNARKAGISGIVEIKVVFSASGEIKSASISGKNHHKILGEASLKTVERVKRDWQPILKPRREQSVIIPVSFELK